MEYAKMQFRRRAIRTCFQILFLFAGRQSHSWGIPFLSVVRRSHPLVIFDYG